MKNHNLNSIFNFKRTLSGIVFTFILFFTGCNWFTSWDDSYYYDIKVDTMNFVSSNVNAGETLKVACWGKVGDDDCCSFSNFDVKNINDTAKINVKGFKRVQYRLICHSADIRLDGKICKIYPVEQGAFTVIINQPDGSTLEKQIWIH